MRPIVPSERLLIWTAIVALPVTILAGIVPTFAATGLAIIVLFLAIMALDAVMGFSVLDGVEPQLPTVVRMSKDREASIEIQIKNERAKRLLLRLALALPREFSTPQEEMNILLPAQATLSRLPWLCTGLRRGRYRLDKCYIEGCSPLGFWSVRTAAAANTELRVYPNLLKERNSVAAIFLNRGVFGAHAQRQIGKGREFEQLRDYIVGDGYEDIHWKATAKRGRPVTKTFRIERTQEVYVVIDASRLSGRAVPGAGTILERYITAGLVLGMAAEQQGDLFGLVTFSDRIESFVRAKNGPAHYNLCRDAIYALHHREASPDFDELTTFIRLRLRRRALLIILTSLDDPLLAESFARNIELICRQHIILINMMQAQEIAPLFSGPGVERVDDLYRRLGGHILWNNLRELGKTLQHRGIQFSLVKNERLAAQLVTQYLTVKRRQLL
jgi:uncharacterized protein (DUF58 family)